jgi:hypothetical protein
MGSIDPDNSLNSTEKENLDRFEATAERGLRTYADVAGALAEIRDAALYRGTHRTFEAYLSERWGIDGPCSSPLRDAPEVPEALAKLCRDIRAALGPELTVADIRLTLDKLPIRTELAPEPAPKPSLPPDLVNGRLLLQLRWLLAQSSGTIADVAYQLETFPFDLDEDARDQLRDDVLLIEEELALLRVLVGSIDWDAELERMLRERPETDADSEDE